MLKNKNVFITGGAGFIASNLIKRIVENNSIVIYDDFTRDSYSNSKNNNHKNIKVIKGDVLDFEYLCESMKNSDIVIHAAAVAGIDTVIKNPTKTMKVNMIGSANVLEAARINKVTDRFVDFSTSEVFGSVAFNSKESQNTVTGSAGEARWTYAVSKIAAEHLSIAYYSEFGLPAVCVRPFNIYGPGQTGEGALMIFVKRALNNEDIHIYGDGTQIRAWCYIEDFIDGLMCCINSPLAVGESFNIGNNRTAITTYGLAKTVCRVLKSKSKFVFMPPPSSEIELRIPSVDKADKILGFRAKTSLEEGIEKTAEWYAHNE